MDLGEKDNFEQEKGNGDLMGYHSANLPLDWRFGGSNLINTSMGSIATVNPMAIGQEGVMNSSSCSTAPMLNSFCPTVWDHPTNTQNLGFNDINLQNIASTSNALEIRKGPLNIERTLDMGWTPPNSMVKGGVFIPTTPGLLPHSLSQFPADSGFIERAARFSCFGGGNFGDLMNPSSITESMNRYNRGAMMVQRTQDVSKDVFLSVEHGVTEGSPIKNDRKSESLVQSHDEAKQGIVVSGNVSDEAEFSGGGGQAKTSMVGGSGGEPPSKGLGLKKRKRSGQDNELDRVKEASEPTGETSNINTEIQQKGDQPPTSTTNKPSGKHGKQQGSQASGSPKEEYIHMRARRGQATNSHSLAERVRREKISERMKFLQDLVPGCSKVTGKAVMLDEIINYVQSLQRQVEFLSMKLATVNPCLDLNLEGLLTKDVIQRAGPSSMLGYSPDMTMAFPQLHPCQPGLIQTGLPGIPNPSDALRRSINTQMATMSGGYKEPAQAPNVWGEDELHNVVHMGFNSSAPLNSQDLNGYVSLDHMKDEL